MIKKLIDAAICRTKCDVVLKNARVADVFGGGIVEGDVGIVGDRIVGIGTYSGNTEYDLCGKYVLPGLIDSHVHIESSQLCPERFASLVLPHGTTTVIADPHEIVNVCGIDGAVYIRNAAARTPLEVKLMLPSCVPATPFETSGATLSAEDIAANITEEYVFGLGEFMNYPAVISGDEQALAKLNAANAAGKICDGHAPFVKGEQLNAYVCGGISTDHECVEREEIEQKIARGMYVMLRHGSSSRNLAENVKCVTQKNMRRFLICTDDRHAADLSQKGHIDDALRQAVAAGTDGVAAVTMATLNAAECYRLKGYGAVAPSYMADLCVVDDIKNFNVRMVFKAGKLVAKEGVALFDAAPRIDACVKDTVHIREITADDFLLKLAGRKARAITLSGGTLITGCSIEQVESRQGDVSLDGTSLLKLAVLERHGKNSNIGKGLIKGYGFKGGAIAITVSHDSHNLIIAGDDNASMAEAANALRACGGGMAIVERGKHAECVPLEIGGLMTAAHPSEFIERSSALYKKAYAMGVKEDIDAFMSLAFLSLAVIPKLRLLDTGLFDVDAFDFTDINA